MPASFRRVLLDGGGYGTPVITDLPFAALRAAYADLGIAEIDARSWYRVRIGPDTAAAGPRTGSDPPRRSNGRM